jgi:Ni/Fe-hydrogenase subunit HybB-like protein
MAGVPLAPHWMELAVIIGLFSAGILIFGLAMKHLPLEEEHTAKHATPALAGGARENAKKND